MNEKILSAINKAKTSNKFHLLDVEMTDEAWNEILKLKKLEDISLFSVKIKKIPKKISKLNRLKKLLLFNNQIKEIPVEISYLKKLELLWIKNNKIETIPAELFNLTKLKGLDLSNNQITNIPAEVIKLQNTHFNFSENPIDALMFIYKTPITKKTHRYTINNKLNFEIENKEDQESRYISIKNINHCRILVFEEKAENSSFIFYIWGDKKNRKKALDIIRKKIDKQLENSKYETTINKYFYYPLNDDYNNEYAINYDKLLNLKQAEEYFYFHENSKKKIPVIDLIEYIDIENTIYQNDWNAEYVTEFKAKNFKLFKEINLKKISPNINIIIGHNGLGKTTILQAITLSLLSVTNSEKTGNFEDFIHFTKERAELYIKDDKKIQRILHIIPSGLHDLENLGGFKQLLLSYGTNINTNEQLSHDKIIQNLITGDAKSYYTKSIFKDYSNDFYDPLVTLTKLFLGKKGAKNKLLDNIIRLIKNTLNEYLDLFENLEKISLEGDNANYYFKDFQGTHLEIKNLSEGYKDFILQITDIIVRIIAARNNIFEKNINIDKNLFTEITGIILIDEFDRHLHSNLQRKFLLQLKKDFPNIQFIITTHNIASIQSGEGENMIILSNDKNIFNFEKIPVGYSIETLYEEYINEHSYSETITAKLSELKKWRNEMLETNNYENLNNKDFLKITNELININSELSSIVNIELNQLYKRKKNVQTK